MAINDVYSSSFATLSPRRYDVFVSFRGEDTRNNFTSHLLTALCEKSIKTYIDVELERGDEISQALTEAIEDSNVSLIVFSENYASSRWCLDELAKILECKKNQGQVVVPVFYKVDPSNVRKMQTDKEALAKHERYLGAFTEDKVHKWRAALAEAANLAGWDSRNFRDESELIKEIVNDVLRKLEHWLRGLVGVEENCKSVELLLEKAPVIGIWGMGGIGDDKDHVIRLLDACNFYATSGIETLQDKALITISKDNRIQMHNLIQEMGWEVVRQEAIKDPGRRSRLRDTEEVYDVLKNNSGTDAVEGIVIDVSQIQELQLSADIFKKMINIRLLKFYGPLNDGSCNLHLPIGLESFSHKLRYLQWNGYPLMSLPSTFCAEKLVELQMRNSHVQKLWDGVQSFVNLKEIDLAASIQLMELPDLSKASKLEIVNVSYCVNLRHIHPSILSLNTLIDLVLYGCKNLKSLNLISVKYLVVNGCLHLKEFSLASGELNMLDLRGTTIEILDKSIGHLNKLEKLYACQSLRKVPSDLPSLTCLRELNLHNCRQLDASNLHILIDASHYVQKLILDGCCNLSKVPYNIEHLSCLEYLSLRDCNRLRSLPKLPLSVGHLDAINCTSLETVFPSTISRHLEAKDINISFENCLKLDEHSRNGIMELHANFTMKHIAYANVKVPHSMHKSGVVCLPGSKVPTMFKNRTNHASIIVELPPPSHLFGFILCVVLSPFCLNVKFQYHQIVCQWCLEDDRRVGYATKWYYKAITELNSDHVYLWYEPSCDKIIEAAKENQAIHKCTTGKLRVSFGFYVETYKLSEPKEIGLIGIKECGVCPIYASEYDNFVHSMELDQTLEHITMGIGSYDEMKDEKEQIQMHNHEDTCHCLISVSLNHLWRLCQRLVRCQTNNEAE